MKNAKELGLYVKQLCEEKNISATELAEFFDCKEEQIQDFFIGESFFSYANFKKLSELLDVPVVDLLDDFSFFVAKNRYILL